MKKALVLFIAMSLLGCASGTRNYTPEMVQHYKGSIFKATETGYYTAELIIRPNPPVVGNNAADLIIHDYRAHDIAGLDIKVTPFLTDGGEASPRAPFIRDEGRGLYVIQNLYYHRPGSFSLKVEIRGPKDDSVILPLPEIKAKQ